MCCRSPGLANGETRGSLTSDPGIFRYPIPREDHILRVWSCIDAIVSPEAPIFLR